MPPAPSRPTCHQPSPTDTILRREGGNRGSVPPGSAVAALPRHLTAVRAHRTAPPAPPARIPSPPAGAGVPGIYGPAAPAPACLLQQGRPPLAAAPRPAPQVGEPQRGPPGECARSPPHPPPPPRGADLLRAAPLLSPLPPSPHHHTPGPVRGALGLGEKFPQVVVEVPRGGSGRGAAGQPHRAAGGAGAAEVPRRSRWVRGGGSSLFEYRFLSYNPPNFSERRIRRSQPCEARGRARLASRSALTAAGCRRCPRSPIRRGARRVSGRCLAGRFQKRGGVAVGVRHAPTSCGDGCGAAAPGGGTRSPASAAPGAVAERAASGCAALSRCFRAKPAAGKSREKKERQRWGCLLVTVLPPVVRR